MSAALRPAVFLDRDGVINENLAGAYVNEWAQFRFLPGAIEAIGALNRAGLPVVVVTNQAGIGRGFMTETALLDIHAQMESSIRQGGARIDAVLYCPHAPADECDCRKPRPGMLRRAAEQLLLDLANSYFVGDNVTDVQAGLAAGCSPILVRGGLGHGLEARLRDDPALAAAAVPVVDDLPSAVRLILDRTALPDATARV